jgi:hypothetical protein
MLVHITEQGSAALILLLPIEADPKLSAHEPQLRDGLDEYIRQTFAKWAWRAEILKHNPDAFLVAFVRDPIAYEAYLKSRKWKRIREQTLRAWGFECACCDRKATQVHHRDYRPRVLAGGDSNALVPLCAECHDKIEDARKSKSWQAGEQRLFQMIAAKNH